MKLLYLFDQFSQTPTLKVNGKKRATTIFSSIIGLLSIFGLTFGIIYLIYDYYCQFNYTFSSYKDNSIRPDIDLKDFRFGFILTDTVGNPIPNKDRLFSIEAKHWDIYFDVTSNSTDIKVSNLPKISCYESLKNGNFEENLNVINSFAQSHGSYCFDFKSLDKNLTGIFNDLGGYFYFIYF